MKMFNTLSLEITARCNRKCKFCPVAYNTRPDEVMPLVLQLKAYKELEKLDYRGRIEFYIYNEPMMKMDHLRKSVKLARKHLPKSCLMIATNGDYIRSVEDLKSLYDMGLNQVLINCYSAKQYPRATSLMNSLDFVDQTKSVYHVLGAKAKVGQVLDKSSPEVFGTGIFKLVNRAGNIQDFIPATKSPVSRMCVKPFRLLNIDWQGRALICCQDYHAEMCFGNLEDSSLEELWNHPVINTYRRYLLNKDRSLPLCNKCDCHAGAYPGNVSEPDGPEVSKQEIVKLHDSNLHSLSRKG